MSRSKGRASQQILQMRCMTNAYCDTKAHNCFHPDVSILLPHLASDSSSTKRKMAPKISGSRSCTSPPYSAVSMYTSQMLACKIRGSFSRNVTLEIINVCLNLSTVSLTERVLCMDPCQRLLGHMDVATHLHIQS